MTVHDPTSIDPVRFTASIIVEAVCEHVCELTSFEPLRETFDRTLQAVHADMPPIVFAELELALDAEGYLDSREWPDKHAMIDLVQRVVSRLRS